MNDYTSYRAHRYPSDLNYCRQFLFGYGSNYAWGTRLMPQEAQEATTILYAFVRYADELVDNPNEDIPGRTHATLDDFIDEWNYTKDHLPHQESHPVMRSCYWLCQSYHIPESYLDDFLQSMKQDTVKPRYHTYQEVQQYMWGSASVIGLMMVHILGGEDDPKTHEAAQSLAEAMQLANFLRDVSEDYHERNRVYLPQDDMKTYKVDDAMLSASVASPELKHLIKVYVGITEELFKKGIQGIKFLSSGRFGVLYASFRYREYLNLIRNQSYDVLHKRPRISRFKKAMLLAKSLYYYFVITLTHRYE